MIKFNNTEILQVLFGDTQLNQVMFNDQQLLSVDDGLFGANGEHIASWYTLVTKYGMDCTSNYNSNSYKAPDSPSPYNVLQNENLRSGVSLVIPDTITTIGSYAFAQCNSLEQVTFTAGSKLNQIGDYAFSSCSELDNITIPSSVASIGSGAFYGCTNLVSINFGKNIKLTTIGYQVFRGCRRLGSIVIPANVTAIGQYAFKDCTNLTSITIPNSVTSISPEVFQGCSKLNSITIPNSVEEIGESAFSGCIGLTSITLPFVGESKYGANNTHFGYIFGASTQQDNVDYVPSSLKTVVITGGTSIGDDAFQSCTGLTSVVIGDSVTSIGEGVFAYCTYLTSVSIGSGVTGIGAWSFDYCGRLELVVVNSSDIAKQLTDSSACGGFMTHALTLVFPANITEIGQYVIDRFTYVDTVIQNGKQMKVYSKHSHAEDATTWNETENGYVCSECGVSKTETNATITDLAGTTWRLPLKDNRISYDKDRPLYALTVETWFTASSGGGAGTEYRVTNSGNFLCGCFGPYNTERKLYLYPCIHGGFSGPAGSPHYLKEAGYYTKGQPDGVMDEPCAYLTQVYFTIHGGADTKNTELINFLNEKAELLSTV